MEDPSRTKRTIEAIKLLKENSRGLVVLQTASIAFVGTMLEVTEGVAAGVLAGATIVTFLISIMASANVIASLPSLVERADTIGSRGIYAERGNLGIRVITSARLQGLFFVIGIALLVAFLFADLLLPGAGSAGSGS